MACSLDAILKYDSVESLYCVYNELVALRLAQTIHMPVADGVLTSMGSQEAYASIELAAPGLRLPDLLPTQYANAAKAYKDGSAALTVFDIFIGNWDRGSNIKASFVTPHVRIFQGFDHEHALLGVESDPLDSIKSLDSMDLIVTGHPFYGHSDLIKMSKWYERIKEIDDALIRECCVLGRPLGAVTTDMQNGLAVALCNRKNYLHGIVVKNMSTIYAWK